MRKGRGSLQFSLLFMPPPVYPFMPASCLPVRAGVLTVQVN